jgi:hypothetical protein
LEGAVVGKGVAIVDSAELEKISSIVEGTVVGDVAAGLVCKGAARLVVETAVFDEGAL